MQEREGMVINHSHALPPKGEWLGMVELSLYAVRLINHSRDFSWFTYGNDWKLYKVYIVHYGASILGVLVVWFTISDVDFRQNSAA